ncbi:hypothetical protein LSH36_100g10017 [Paralvinella palmiformis]|uniref:26S proteasome non-ATPase regulatory subunit 13 n=1 Tax=Paralvinella palmiformis TaxID=53620 RepID=A0AAD9N9Z6_9ANNE|nr:hypothetical protein LSH36_100g10017 [Paralvinella palmiformis]
MESASSKISSTRFSPAWINSNIKRLARRKKRAYNKVKSTKDPDHWNGFKHLTKIQRTSCRDAYNRDIITPDFNKHPKSFCSFFKSKRRTVYHEGNRLTKLPPTMARDVAGYLAEQQRKSTGELAQDWATIEELYNKKLWHQLTLKLLQFVKNPIFSQGDGLVKMYHNFISDFDHRINPLAFMEIILFVIKQMKDPKETIEFLDKIKEKQVLKDAESVLDSIDGISTVHGRFYELSSNYHKLMGNHALYYREALRFLGCIDLADIPVPEQVERAFNLGLAAILGEGVYNFGELLAHPVLDKLKGTEKEWLVGLLYTFNSGNISRFEELKQHWQNQMTFKRPATDRLLSFKEISAETRLPTNEIEFLVMKALSLKLVKGSIDEVEQKVHMTWVQPRVLDREQIAVMQKKLNFWNTDVKEMEKLVEDKAQDILA